MEDDDYDSTITLNQEVLFIILIPPIIFEGSFNMDKRSFFKQFGSILVFAFLGTFLSILIVGLSVYGFTDFSLYESLAFGSLISATDPVTVLSIMKQLNADKFIHSIIYGESVLNDAVAIILYKTLI